MTCSVQRLPARGEEGLDVGVILGAVRLIEVLGPWHASVVLAPNAGLPQAAALLELYRAMGATGHAERLGRELGASNHPA